MQLTQIGYESIPVFGIAAKGEGRQYRCMNVAGSGKRMASTWFESLTAAAQSAFGRIRAKGQGCATSDRSLSVSPQVRVSSHTGGLVLLEISRGLVFTCNHTGRLVWEGLVARTPPAAIAAGLGREYGMPVEQAQDQVFEFIAALCRNRLLAVAGER